MSTTTVNRAPPYGYWIGLALIVAVIVVGAFAYLQQLEIGLGVTGMGRDVSWGLYIAQFAFAEGLAAAAVVVLLPAYLHGSEAFERVALLGVLLAIAGVLMSMLFIMVDLGQPARVLNVMLYPTPSSAMFWDMVSLGGYLAVNVIIALALLLQRRTGIAAPGWLRALVLVSIPWGFAVHAVTAFLLGGLAARPLWFTTILAPRFLASAFACSSAALLLLFMVLRRWAGFDAGAVVRRTLSIVMTYALCISLFFLAIEVATILAGQLPEHIETLRFLYVGLEGHAPLAPLMWLSAALMIVAAVLLLTPRLRAREPLAAVAAVFVVAGLGLDKGFSFVFGGFVPTPLGTVPSYVPTLPEWSIVAGIWAIGALLVAVSWRVALAARAGT